MSFIIRAFYGLLCVMLCTGSLNGRDWDEIKASGVLKVGMRDLSSLAYDSGNKVYPGFLYEMVSAFAKAHDLKMELIIVDSFSAYWMHNGEVLTQTQRIEVPEIYNTIDVAAEAFTVTKQRQKLIHMSPYIENMELFFGNNQTPLKGYEDLIGKRILLYEGMSFYPVFINELQKRKIPFERIYIRPKDDTIEPITSHEDRLDKVNLYLFPADEKVDGKLIYHYIAKGLLDGSVNDSLGVIFRLFSNSYYSQNLRPYFPLSLAKTELAWGSSPNSPKLNDAIDEFIAQYKASGTFSKQLKRYTGMDLAEYEALLMMIE
jgi:ABC-type amino acid transport substrate-binding protein